MKFELSTKSNILITGGKGFIGSNLKRFLHQEGYNNISTPGSKEYNLVNEGKAIKMIDNYHPDLIINLAAKHGNIKENQESPSDFFYENLMIGVNVLRACIGRGVGKVVNIGSATSYPESIEMPLKEANLWSGLPGGATRFYGLAKRDIIQYSEAVRTQHNLNTINLIITNIHGPEQKSGVISDTIKKLREAKDTNKPSVTFWGSGEQTRDFLYVDDASRAILLATANLNETSPINIGSGEETSIREVVETSKDIIGYRGEIVWDTTKPEGVKRRCLDVTRARDNLGFKASTSLKEGLEKIIHHN